MSKKYKGKPCVYCVINPSEVGEHVIARKFFLHERRQNLPKVPACKSCNGMKAELESYLLSILPFGGRHGDAASNLELVPERLANNARLQRSLAQGSRRVWVEEKGVYVPAMGLPIEPARIQKLFEFIAKGLMWFHWGVYLTTEHFIEVTSLTASEEELFDQFFHAESPCPKVSGNLGNGTFVYKGFREVNSPETTSWKFSVYGGVKLVGGPPARREVSLAIGVDTGFVEHQFPSVLPVA